MELQFNLEQAKKENPRLKVFVFIMDTLRFLLIVQPTALGLILTDLLVWIGGGGG